jgi:hypothetical protein
MPSDVPQRGPTPAGLKKTCQPSILGFAQVRRSPAQPTPERAPTRSPAGGASPDARAPPKEAKRTRNSTSLKQKKFIVDNFKKNTAAGVIALMRTSKNPDIKTDNPPAPQTIYNISKKYESAAAYQGLCKRVNAGAGTSHRDTHSRGAYRIIFPKVHAELNEALNKNAIINKPFVLNIIEEVRETVLKQGDSELVVPRLLPANLERSYKAFKQLHQWVVRRVGALRIISPSDVHDRIFEYGRQLHYHRPKTLRRIAVGDETNILRETTAGYVLTPGGSGNSRMPEVNNEKEGFTVLLYAIVNVDPETFDIGEVEFLPPLIFLPCSCNTRPRHVR